MPFLVGECVRREASIMLLNSEFTYKKLATFEDVFELNLAVKEYHNQYAEQLTPATRNVLDVLARYACVYIGVCYLSKGKIAAELGISRRTVIRACNQLEALGIIKQHETKRHSGGRRRSTNAIVIQRVTTGCHSEEALAKAIKVQDINNTLDTQKADSPLVPAVQVIEDQERKDQEHAALKTGLLTKLPSPIVALAPFFGADRLYKLAGVVFKAKAKVDRSVSLEHNADVYKDTLLSAVNAFKRGKVRNLEGVIYTAIKQTTQAIKVKALADEVWA